MLLEKPCVFDPISQNQVIHISHCWVTKKWNKEALQWVKKMHGRNAKPDNDFAIKYMQKTNPKSLINLFFSKINKIFRLTIK